MSIVWAVVAIIAFHVGIMWLFWVALSICGVAAIADLVLLLSALGS